MIEIWKRLKRWWEGKFVPPPPPSSGVFRIKGQYERHWTAKLARYLVKFYLAHWQWLFGTAIAIGILLAAFAT